MQAGQCPRAADSENCAMAAVRAAIHSRAVEVAVPALHQRVRGRAIGENPLYFKMLMVGFFENIAGERGIAERCSDSLSIRAFLGYDLTGMTPDHSTLSITRAGPAQGWVRRFITKSFCSSSAPWKSMACSRARTSAWMSRSSRPMPRLPKSTFHDALSPATEGFNR